MPHKNLSTPRAARPTDLSSKVRKQRQSKGLSTAKLAEVAGVSVRTIQRLENGTPVSADKILRVERALGLAGGTLVPDWNIQASFGSNTIGPRLRERRRELRLTLKDVVDGTGLSVATLSRLERGLLGDIHHEDPPINSVLIKNLDFWNWDRYEKWVMA